MRERFLEECKIIQQNCTYNAETHHRIAASAKRKAVWFEVVPAVVAALTGTLVSAGVGSINLLPLTAVSAAISAITAVINPNKEYQNHLAAAKNFTAIKHDARFLCNAHATRMSD